MWWTAVFFCYNTRQWQSCEVITQSHYVATRRWEDRCPPPPPRHKHKHTRASLFSRSRGKIWIVRWHVHITVIRECVWLLSCWSNVNTCSHGAVVWRSAYPKPIHTNSVTFFGRACKQWIQHWENYGVGFIRRSLCFSAKWKAALLEERRGLNFSLKWSINNFMELIPPWEVGSHSSTSLIKVETLLLFSQEPGTGPYSESVELVHTLIPNVSKIHFNNIIPSTPAAIKLSPFLGFTLKR
jgi:hypothetical protein